VQLREATLDDAAGILALLREAVCEPASGVPLALNELPQTEDEQRQRLAERLAEPRARMVIAQAEVGLVGQASLRPYSPRRALGHVGVIGIGVRAAWRRKGVGRAMLAELVAGAPHAGYTRLELNVYARNTGAIALYEQLGFVREGVRRGMVRDGDECVDDVVMGRLL
jgi:putative acetyltransferase